jgi:hypothetical protein
VHAVRPVYIGMARRPEHSCIPGRPATEAVRGRIVAGVRFSLDNSPADPVDEQDGSNQIAGNRHRITSEEGP